MNSSSFFTHDPLDYIRGDERSRAVTSLERYLEYTGAHFELLIASSDPNRITERDLVAVTMLSIDVPGSVALWLLGDGAHRVSSLLARIDTSESALWQPTTDIGPGSAAWDLYGLVKGQSGLGRTKASKLLAAKRPHLLPVFDAVMQAALGIGDDEDDWAAWRSTLADESVRDEIQSLRDQVSGAIRFSLLRVMDVVIWMRKWGWDHAHDKRPNPLPPFDSNA